jgi:hypothetical protein
MYAEKRTGTRLRIKLNSTRVLEIIGLVPDHNKMYNYRDTPPRQKKQKTFFIILPFSEIFTLLHIYASNHLFAFIFAILHIFDRFHLPILFFQFSSDVPPSFPLFFPTILSPKTHRPPYAMEGGHT